MIDLHELINRPGYGVAEKELRNRGMWRLTKDEKFNRLLIGLDNAIEEAQGYVGDLTKALEAE